jgi:hypothetical protein
LADPSTDNFDFYVCYNGEGYYNCTGKEYYDQSLLPGLTTSVIIIIIIIRFKVRMQPLGYDRLSLYIHGYLSSTSVFGAFSSLLPVA